MNCEFRNTAASSSLKCMSRVLLEHLGSLCKLADNLAERLSEHAMRAPANWIGVRGNHAIQPNAINETRQFNDMSSKLLIFIFFLCNHSNDVKGPWCLSGNPTNLFKRR